MDAPLLEAIKVAKSVFADDFPPLSPEDKLQIINLLNTQIQRLQMKPGDLVPLGLTFRERYDTLLLLSGAIVDIQGRAWHSEDFSFDDHEETLLNAEKAYKERLSNSLESCLDASTEDGGKN